MNWTFNQLIILMKTIPLIGIMMLTMSTFVLAQPGGERPKQQKVEELKIAFITSELNLTSEEAQKFWPVYNEMSEKLKGEKKKQREIARDIRENAESLSDGDYQKKSEAYLESNIREAQIKKEYHGKIAAVIGYKKATKLLSLEQRFKRELLNRLNQGQPGGQGRPPVPDDEF